MRLAKGTHDLLSSSLFFKALYGNFPLSPLQAKVLADHKVFADHKVKSLPLWA